ncbi:MAG: hypothetical protein K2L23_02370, partial [Odoribacter sp.]|nr:hypothetical protein [Odoribacter sp.]
MRKIVIYLLLALGFTSCEKYLEVSPTNTLVVKSYEDVKALMGAHPDVGKVSEIFLGGVRPRVKSIAM